MKNSRTTIIIVSIICATLVALSGIGALVYVNQQSLAQQKELKEQEIKASNKRAEKQRVLDEKTSTAEQWSNKEAACNASGGTYYGWSCQH